MNGRYGDTVRLLIDVAEIHSTSSSGQSQWVEVVYTGKDGRRGCIRIELAKLSEGTRRISL